MSFELNPQAGNVSECGGAMTTLSDFNDWANLNFGDLSDADGAMPYPKMIITEQPVPLEYR